MRTLHDGCDTRRTGTLYWLQALLHDASLDPTETLLMIGLADHVDDEDECFVGIETLARYARVSYATARRRLDALTEQGRLERSRRRRSDGNLSTYTWRLVRSPVDNGASPQLKMSGGVPGPQLKMSGDQRSPGRAVTSAHLGERAEVTSDELPSDELGPTSSNERIATPSGQPGEALAVPERQGSTADTKALCSPLAATVLALRERDEGQRV